MEKMGTTIIKSNNCTVPVDIKILKDLMIIQDCFELPNRILVHGTYEQH